MKVWKDKEGNWINGKEFFVRWKQGMQKAVLEMSPLQQTQGQLLSSSLIIFGLLCGIIVSSWKIKVLWWLTITLSGSFMLVIFQTMGIYQRYVVLKNLEEVLKKEIYFE